ncbi:MAG: SDR family oxidoreductase [Alphaproteobacteria bacterium]|nr:SDR family oxidoreductase [Alphaproteobacteria bacterium]
MLTHGLAEPAGPKRVVLLGAGGFVGGAIAKRLALLGIATLALTRKEMDLLVQGAGDRLAGLLRDDDSLVFVSALAPTRTAAMLIDNLRMGEAVTQALAKRPVAHVVYISSDAVYPDDANPVTERTPCHPVSLHGVMHLAREVMLRTAVRAPLAILRPSLLYGAADPHNGYGPNRFRRLAAKGESITLFGGGEEMRDHVLIDDVGALAVEALRHRSAGVLNVATGQSHSFRRVAEMAAALVPAKVQINDSPRQNPITHRHFDVTDCLKAFPTFRYTNLADGLARTAKES